MHIEPKTLKNNLKTLFLNSPGAKSATVQIWFRAGSAIETKENQGIAHFLEHMFFKGTKKRPGSKIAHEVESFGGEINAFTSFDYTCYYINTPNEYLKKTIQILLDMVANPLFEESEIIPERQVVLEEYKRSQDNPHQYNFQQLQNTSFTKSYKHPILGTRKSILNFSREQLLEFRKKFYHTGNAMLAIAGDFKQSQIEREVEKFKLPHGEPHYWPSFKLKNSIGVSIHKKQVRQSSLTLAIESPEYLSAKSAPEDLAINCLSHGETSRLYQKIVLEKGLANHISGSSMFFSRGGAHFIKFLFPENNLKNLLEGIKNLLIEILEKGFSESELQKIKNQYIASKVYEQESLEGTAFSFGHGFAQNGNIHCEDDFIELLKKTTLEETQESFKEIFTRNIHMTLQTPLTADLKDGEKLLKDYSQSISDLFSTKFLKEKKVKEPLIKDDPSLEKKILAPGVTFLHRHNPTAPTFVLHAYIKGGLSEENTESNGIYNLLAKNLTYGYKGSHYENLKNDLANKSASLSGFTGKNAFGLTSHGQSKDFPDLCKHFMGSLLYPKFPKKFLDHEKKLTINALNNSLEDPLKICFQTFNKLIFRKHHYSFDPLGTKSNIQKITTRSLKNEHQKALENKEVLITYCGSQSLDEIFPHIKRHMKNLKKRKVVKTKPYRIPRISAQEKHLLFDREQSQIFMGYPSYPITHKNYLYLRILSSHLSGQSSELFVDVRDRKGLCYAVQPVNFSALEAGYWGIYIGAGAEKTTLAIEAIQNIFNKFKNKGFTRTHLNRVKKMLRGQKQIAIQTHNDYASLYSVPVLHGLGADFSYRQLEKIEGIELEEFNSFLKKFFKNPPHIIIAGPELEKM